MSLDAIIYRKRPSWFQRLQQRPFATLARTLHANRPPPRPSVSSDTPGIVVVCISDTHNSQPKLPPGDLLIHAGDFTQHGTFEELQSQLDWINRQTHSQKVVISGNHDLILDSRKAAGAKVSPPLRWGNITYLEDSAESFKFPGGRTLTVYGSPWTRKHGNWAFQYDHGVDVFGGKVAHDADILVTHGPPKFHLDVAAWGEESLLRELWRVKPKLHVFGHIHDGYGQETLVYDDFEKLYESICAGYLGLLALLKMTLLLLVMYIARPSEDAVNTTLINASAVGGLLDENVHQPLCITL